ncbi:MAG: putative DNA binding domain-containing protein [Erysipelotrichaceae bacterium]|nr:putative DNA binding domain-containing protein [Erysipelotrichaceae bacterium]
MRETKILEFKENENTNTFLKTVSAFANYLEGDIIFGVSDNGNIVGINNPEEACLNIENKINDNIKPVPTYTLDIQFDNTIILHVFEGQFKPYFFKSKAYKRNNTVSVEVDRLELNRLILQGQNLNFEDIISNKQDLTFNVLEEDFIQKLGMEKLNNDVLISLGFYTLDYSFNNAAALLADKNQFKGVDIIRFGDNIDEIRFRKTYDHESILSCLNKSMDVFKLNYIYEKIEDASRTIIESIPKNAFREGLANALIHRQWDTNTYIKISMYNDRIEITSPGGLPTGISKEEYLHSQISVLRNPIIANVLHRLRYIEKFGTGILRINNAYANTLVKPNYIIFENSITIILPVISTNQIFTQNELEIINILDGNKKLSRTEIEKQVGFNKDKTLKLLNSLIKKNTITKSGNGRSTKYYRL